MERYFLLALAIAIGSGGQILMKLGVNQLSLQMQKVGSWQNFWHLVFLLLRNPLILSAIGIYGAGFFVWLFTLSRFELSFALPVVAGVYVVVMLLAWIFLRESITPLRVAGTLLIALGIILTLFTQNNK